MSNLINTNPKYLSQLINKHKGGNFCCYINYLRINYIITLFIENIKLVTSQKNAVIHLYKFLSMLLEKKLE